MLKSGSALFVLFVTLVLAAPFKALHAQPCAPVCAWPKVLLQASKVTCGEWQPALLEEFEGDSLDRSVWQTHFYDSLHPSARIQNPYGEQVYLDERVEVADGICILHGRYDPGVTFTNAAGESFVRDISSGMITMPENDFLYGRYEASIRVPGPGWWPAFWVWNHDEIDIMENFGSSSRFAYNVYSGQCVVGNEHSVLPKGSPTSLRDSFHTYAIEFTPFSLTFFFDGQPLPAVCYKYYRADGTPLTGACGDSISGGEYFVNPVFPQAWHRRFAPILNLAVLPKFGEGECPTGRCFDAYCYDCKDNPQAIYGNCDWGYPLDSKCRPIPGRAIPARMEIDYVRVLERSYGASAGVVAYMGHCEREERRLTEPYSCSRACGPGHGSRVYLEDLQAKQFLTELKGFAVEPLENARITALDTLDSSFVYERITAAEARVRLVLPKGEALELVFPERDLLAMYGKMDVPACAKQVNLPLDTCVFKGANLEQVRILSWAGEQELEASKWRRGSERLHLDLEEGDLARGVRLDMAWPCGEQEQITIRLPKCNLKEAGW